MTVTGVNGESDTDYLTIIALTSDSQQHELGDINNDGNITIVDVLLCANYILEMFELQPEEYIAADVDASGFINIYDLLLISDMSN